MDQPNTRYRYDIDGLRAIAVLLVLCFHLDLNIVPGGFIGVDIFYVISGFVISRSMLPALQQGRFSLTAFYDRRIRRIYPALLFTLLLCLALGYFLQTPTEFKKLGESSLAALFSGSNIYFNDRLDYFAGAAKTVALLHTWSLGIEVQFYLLAPLMILAALRFNRSPHTIPQTLLAIIFLSFAASIFVLYGLNDPQVAFYLPITRFWEIAIGGFLAVYENRTSKWASGRYLIAPAFLLMIASASLIDSNTNFPGFSVLAPVIATACLIAIPPRQASLRQRFLTSFPMRFFGNISYSLYLFHWPVIVFWGAYLGRAFTPMEKLAVLVIATTLSAISWYWLETPFRKARQPKSRKQALWTTLALFVTTGMIALFVLIDHGVPSRMDAKSAAVIDKISKMNQHTPTPNCVVTDAYGTMDKASIRLCAPNAKSSRSTHLIWGDSHADMLIPQLAEALNAQGDSLLTVTMPDCQPLIDTYTSKRKNRAECAALASLLPTLVAKHNIKQVILASRWANLASDVRAPSDGKWPKKLFDSQENGGPIAFSKALRRTASSFTNSDARVLIVGPVPEIEFDVPNMAIRSSYLNKAMPHVSAKDFLLRQEKVLGALGAVNQLPNTDIFYPHSILCDETRCLVQKDGALLYVDDDHLSNAGAQALMAPLLKAVNGAKSANGQ